ncbi:MAG: DUF883 domain-containing protein [Limnobacter sp.]|nr:DUF883 domain-containing protein [Limnobacter sp.]
MQAEKLQSNSTPTAVKPANQKNQFVNDIKSVLHEAEEMLRAAASASGERAVELREKALVTLKTAREAMQDAQSAALAKGKVAARATDEYVHEHPWKAVGIAGAIGLVLGLLLNRR